MTEVQKQEGTLQALGRQLQRLWKRRCPRCSLRPRPLPTPPALHWGLRAVLQPELEGHSTWCSTPSPARSDAGQELGPEQHHVNASPGQRCWPSFQCSRGRATLDSGPAEGEPPAFSLLVSFCTPCRGRQGPPESLSLPLEKSKNPGFHLLTLNLANQIPN